MRVSLNGLEGSSKSKYVSSRHSKALNINNTGIFLPLQPAAPQRLKYAKNVFPVPRAHLLEGG